MSYNIKRAYRFKRRRYRFNGLRLLKTLALLFVIIFIITLSGKCLIKNINKEKPQEVELSLPENVDKQTESSIQEDDKININKDPSDKEEKEKEEEKQEEAMPKAESVLPNLPENNAAVKPPKVDTSSSEDQQNPSPRKYDEFFQDTVFVGDSITEGVSFFELTEDSKVVSEKGFTVAKAEKEIDRIVKAKPEHIFIQLGLNDMLYNISSEKFAKQYSDFVQNLTTKIPGVNIYIQAIFPVSAKMEQKRPELSNAKIDEFNNALSKMSKELNIQFIDVASILKDDQGKLREEYTSDGIHLKYKSYILWFDHLKASTDFKSKEKMEIQ